MSSAQPFMEETIASLVLKGLATGPRLRWKPTLVGFSDGFVGGVLGGAAYRVLVSQLHATGWECPWVRVVLVALLLGCFEAWRATRQARMEDVNWRMAWLLGTSVCMLWALSVLVGSAGPVIQTPRRLELRDSPRRDLFERCGDRRWRGGFEG